MALVHFMGTAPGRVARVAAGLVLISVGASLGGAGH